MPRVPPFDRYSHRRPYTPRADFSDAVSPDTPADVFARVLPAAAYYKELSYGKMQPVFSPLLTMLRMPRPSTSYSPSSRQYFLDAADAAIQLGWDFTLSDSIGGS